MGSITFTWKMCVCESESPQIQVTVISFINGKMINAQPVCDQGIAKNEMVENNICVENIVHWQPSKPDVSRPPNFSDLSLLSYFLSIIIQFMAETAAIYEIRESFPWKGLTLKESPTLSKMLQNPHKVFDNNIIWYNNENSANRRVVVCLVSRWIPRWTDTSSDLF